MKAYCHSTAFYSMKAVEMDNKKGNKTLGLTENNKDKQYDNTVMTEFSLTVIDKIENGL